MVAATTEPQAVVSIAGEFSPDVVLVNLRLARNELGWVTRLAEASPHELIVVADDTRPELIGRALALGAACVVGESIQPDDLARAILLVSNQAPVVIGHNPRPAADAATTVAHAAERLGAEALTKRELEILELVADGRTKFEVAQMLWVTQQTVKFHLANIYRKLGVAIRTPTAQKQAVAHTTTACSPPAPDSAPRESVSARCGSRRRRSKPSPSSPRNCPRHGD